MTLLKFKKFNAKQADRLLRQRLPALKRALKSIEEASKVSRELLRRRIDI